MMQRRSALLLALTLWFTALTPCLAIAQGTTDRDGVRRAALDYVEGFYEGDTAKLVRSIRSDVHKYGFDWMAKDKRYTGEQMTWDEILGYARRFKEKGRTTSATAPRKVELLDVLDQTASAKVTAWWGTDYLLLAKYDGRWMITHVLWQSPTPTQ
ncbi:MAG: hypothetical protein JWL61_4493 [Gemmatimonadetes bacterium]|nr:hypothetical protein [Gemmatimonadota bacterium]